MSTAPIRRVLDRLADTGLHETGSGWSARCPAHDDGKASLSIAEGDEGRVLLNCHAGCDHKAIVSALGLEEADLFDRDDQRRPTAKAGKAKKAGKAYPTSAAAVAAYKRTLGEPTDVYEYHVAGELVGLVLRWSRPDGTKEIRPVSRHADGWRLEHMPTPRPLWMVDVVNQARGSAVCVVEGEKCVNALSLGLGILATTSPGGSNAAGKADWSPLAGREVVILPDADKAGRQYADEVAEILLRLDPPAIVGIVDLAPDADDGSDVADLWTACRNADELKALRERIERLAGEAEPLQPKAATTSSSATRSSAPPVEAYQPYPVDALPEPLASFVAETADAIGCDPAYVALPLLAVAGSAIGTTRRLELKAGYSVPAILWSVIVGESGTSKSPALRTVLEHVRGRERRLREEHALDRRDYEDAVEAYEKARSAWRASKSGGDPPERPAEPASRRCLVTDVTVEALAVKLADNPRGLLLARDELAGWLNSLDRYAKSGGGSGDESFYLSAYNGEPHAVDRRTGDRREVYVAQAALWLTGSIQPAILRRALGTERRESGLLARLLLTAPPPRPATWSEKEVSPLTRQWLHDVLDRLYALDPDADAEGREEPRLVRLEADAKAAYVQWHDRHGEELASLTGDRAAAWSKLRESGARLSLIIHAVRVAAGKAASDDVDAESMERALRLVEWHKAETRRVYAIVGQTDEEAAERQSDDRLAAWIDRHGGATTARDLVSRVRWIATSDEAEAALRRLVAAGRGEWRERPPSERGGRPTRDFVLHRQPAVEAGERPEPKVASAKPREEAGRRGLGCADTDAGAQGGEEAVEI